MKKNDSPYGFVKYEDGADQYVVKMSAVVLPLSPWGLPELSYKSNVFEELRENPPPPHLKGEKLVAGIIRMVGHGIYKIERTKNGVPNNGVNGEPALIEHGKDGSVTFNFLTDGKLNDGPNGEPAVQKFAKTKAGWQPVEIKSFQDGVEQPLPEGEIAYAVRRESLAPQKPKAPTAPKMG